MPRILHIGLHRKSLRLLQDRLQVEDVVFCQAEGKDLKACCKALHQYEVLLIGEEVDNPIRFAQEAYTHDKNISVLLVNDGSNYAQLKQALQFSPFIGPTVQCISNEVAAGMALIVEDALQRTRQRRSFAKLKTTTLATRQLTPNIQEKVRTDFTTKVLEEAPIGAGLISGSGIVFSMNRYALDLFGKSEKEVLGTPFPTLFPENIAAEVKHFLLDGYLSAPKRVFEIKQIDGLQYLEISVTSVAQEAASNYRLVILNNITSLVIAQQHTQAQVEKLEKLNFDLARVNADLDTFVYTASHDLKSPILNIEGLVASLEEELGPAQAAVAQELEHIKRSIQRFKQTVEDLTEISRVQKSFAQEAVLLDINQVLGEMEQLLEREIRETGASIVLQYSGSPSVFFPKHNLTSILYNLLNNAIKYRAPQRRPHIQVSTWREDNYFCISVKDNGLGIPVDKRERVFQLFKRMHSHVRGSGVGLYLVKRIVENHGGGVTLESEEGVGSVFIVRFKEYSQG